MASCHVEPKESHADRGESIRPMVCAEGVASVSQFAGTAGQFGTLGPDRYTDCGPLPETL